MRGSAKCFFALLFFFCLSFSWISKCSLVETGELERNAEEELDRETNGDIIVRRPLNVGLSAD